VARDSAVVITTRYGLEGPGIEHGCGRDLLHTSILALRPPSLLQNGVLPGDKAVWAWRRPPTPSSSAEVRERVELYLYSPVGLHGLF